MEKVGWGRKCEDWLENGRCTFPFKVECWRKHDCCWVEVNQATHTCWGYYLILNIGVPLSQMQELPTITVAQLPRWSATSRDPGLESQRYQTFLLVQLHSIFHDPWWMIGRSNSCRCVHNLIMLVKKDIMNLVKKMTIYIYMCVYHNTDNSLPFITWAHTKTVVKGLSLQTPQYRIPYTLIVQIL